MIWLRSLIFQILFYGWTLTMGVAFLPLLVLPRSVAMWGARFWCRSVLGLLRVTTGLSGHIEQVGERPTGPAIFAAKHQSAWDTMMITRLLPDPAIVLKKELLSVPFFGWYVRRHGAIAIDRKAGASALRQMLRDARRAVEDGRDIFVFPEGTRTAPGERRPYHSGVAALYRDLGLPVVPVALNSGMFWGRRSFLKRAGDITLRVLPPIPPGLKRREFMQRLEKVIETETTALTEAARAALDDASAD
ncbi:MAG: lysophospholipid acyltransferase family protein [Alphaproteobacteria bacterium]